MPKALTFIFARMTPKSIALSTLSGPTPEVQLPSIHLYLEPSLSLKFNISILRSSSYTKLLLLLTSGLLTEQSFCFYLWSLRIIFDLSLLFTYYTQSTCRCIGSHPTTASLPPALLFHFHGQHPSSIPIT